MNSQPESDKPERVTPLATLAPTPEQTRSDAFLAALLREQRAARYAVARDFAAAVRALAG